MSVQPKAPLYARSNSKHRVVIISLFLLAKRDCHLVQTVMLAPHASRKQHKSFGTVKTNA